MLSIKLVPTGRKHDRHYQILVTPTRSKISTIPVAVLGKYHPRSRDLVLDKKALAEWLAKGAQPTIQVRKLCKIS